MTNITSLFNEIQGYTWNVIELFMCITIFVVMLLIVRWAFATYMNVKTPYIVLQLISPSFMVAGEIATKELMNVIHGISLSPSFIDRLLGITFKFSLELISTKQKGIRYIVRVPVRYSSVIRQTILSYIPEVIISDITDEVTNTTKQTIIYVLQREHFAFPLHEVPLNQHDPIAYVTGSMTGLEEDEQISLQIIAKPIFIKESRSLVNKIMTNDDILSGLSGKRKGVLTHVFFGINSLIFAVVDFVSMNGSTSPIKMGLERHMTEVAMKLKPSRVISSFEQELLASMQDKIEQRLFKVIIRASVAVQDKTRRRHYLQTLRSSISSYNVPHYQQLDTRIARSWSRLTSFLYVRRLNIRASHEMLLSSSELATLYHFPNGITNRIENVVKSFSRVLPPPLSLKNDPIFDVLIGENVYHGIKTPIGLTEKEREKHVYVIGGTGNGKTTMIQYMIIQDIKNGKGVAVVDPHGDMSEEILSHIPQERIKEVIFFNPDDLAYPIGLNLLELDEKLSGDDLLREKDIITESVVSIFRKIFSDDGDGGHKIEYILRNAVQTALTLPGSTLFTIYELLNDEGYRTKVANQLEDKNLKNFWLNEIGRAGDMQRVKMVSGITSKVGRFLFSASARRILEQPKSTINFEKIINEQKILICKFSKGMIGEDTSELLGIMVIAKLHIASLKRARVQLNSRPAFYLYVDEFQNFATVSFVEMLSESRKYKLFLTMAEQSTSQQNNKDMVNIILANVGTVITFRSGNPVDEKVLLPLFNGHIAQGEIMNLASFHFFIRMAAVHSQEPLSGVTILAEKGTTNKHAVVNISRKMYSLHSSHTIQPDLVKSQKKSIQKVSITGKK